MKKKKQYYRAKEPESETLQKILNARDAQGASTSLVPVKGKKQMAFYVPTLDTLQDKIADELLGWAFLPDSIQIKKFFYSRLMSYDDFKEKTADNPYCQMILKMVRDIIADKLQMGWHTKELDGNYAQFYARLYDNDYVKMQLLLKATAAAQANTTTTVQVVEIPAIPSSDLVKERST